MAAVTFDTLKFVDTLEKAQMPREQARAIAEAVQNTHETANLATKADIDKLYSDTDSKFDRLRAEISQFRKEMEVRFAEMELRLTIRVGVIVTTVMGVFTAIIKLT